MAARRANARQLEAMAWVSLVCLLAGVVGVLSWHSPTPARAAVDPTPVLVPQVRVTTTQVPIRTTVHRVRTAHTGRTVLAVPAGPGFGPPPGPQFDPAPAHTAAPADRYAVLVGITHYHYPTHETIGGAADARFIAGTLEQSGWLPDHIRLLTDDDATGSAIRSAMAWLAAKGQPGTFTMFHYSGHVKQDSGLEFLWPIDRDFISNDAVRAALSQVTGHLWVDIAGCESAGFLPGLPSDRVLVSTSSEVTQKSYEYPDWGMSVWTGLLFSLGMAQGQADADGNGTVTIGEALRYAGYYAHRLTVDQVPYGPQIPQVAGDPVRGWTLSDPPA